jgi:exodeoxyribonuclease VII large subunit
MDPGRRLTGGADDLLVTLVTDQQDVDVLAREAAGLGVHLGNERAGGIDGSKVAASRLLVHDRRDAMGGEHDDRAFRHLVGLLDEDRPPGLEPGDHVGVVDDLLADVDGCAVPLERDLHGLHGAVDSGAISARSGEEHSSLSTVRRFRHDPIVGRAYAEPMPLQSSAESPLPVRTVAKAIGDWIGRLGRVWVEGQVTEVTRRPGQSMAFLVLRDTAVEMSLRVSCRAVLIDDITPPLTQGARILVWGRPEYWAGRGSLTFTAYDVKPVGIGALLARLEELRKLLAAEGLFAAERKRALPFLPRKIGLVTGRSSAAERDVVENARRRWPAVDFRIEAVAVQGAYAVTQVIEAVQRLDVDPEVDVIVIARGGGSMEDLLPFSDEALVRAVAACFTPVVSAIGHETDVPLVDHAADHRASTPTDAGKLVVPDVGEELARVGALLARARRTIVGRIDSEQQRLDSLRTRPALADPQGVLAAWRIDLQSARERSRRATLGALAQATATVAALRGQIAALSPQATLDRGYAVLQRADGSIARDADELIVGDHLTGRLARGRVPLIVEDVSS